MAGVKVMVAACFLLLALLFSFGFQPSEERPLNLADNNNNGFSSLKTAETHPPPSRRNQKAGANNGGASAADADADINDTTPGHSPGVGHSGGPSSAVGPKA
ncbi:PREDICTED: uncharacterized protein LOC109169786 [Ipomoea nil]|uniref:uncharacterized protein LOC109169786 n=1 Tax=Ipomoea nil TaxID=35883 RepID=UPI000901FB41|nr:PREDICTED: uncharacterized protein LOC109169786 [Ipomoea nil]